MRNYAFGSFFMLLSILLIGKAFAFILNFHPYKAGIAFFFGITFLFIFAHYLDKLLEK